MGGFGRPWGTFWKGLARWFGERRFYGVYSRKLHQKTKGKESAEEGDLRATLLRWIRHSASTPARRPQRHRSARGEKKERSHRTSTAAWSTRGSNRGCRQCSRGRGSTPTWTTAVKFDTNVEEIAKTLEATCRSRSPAGLVSTSESCCSCSSSLARARARAHSSWCLLVLVLTRACSCSCSLVLVLARALLVLVLVACSCS